MAAMAPDTSERMKGRVGLLGLGDADEVVLKVDIWRDEGPKRPLLDMLAREEQERKERLRVGRAEEQEFSFG